MNNSAQMNVLEVIIVSGILIVGLYFVRGMEFSSRSVEETENQLEVLGESVLNNLASKPDTHEGYSNALSRHISSKEHYSNLTDEINSTFPLGTLYKVEKVDMSKMFHENAAIINCTETIYEPPVWIQDETRVSRIVVSGGTVYEVVITLWFNLRR